MTFNAGPCNATNDFIATIEFFCDPAIHLGAPVLITQDKCSAFFQWYSAVACVVSPVTSNACVLVDDINEQTFNLTGLYHEGNYLVNTTEYLYELNVCGNLTSKCGSVDAAVCQHKHNNFDYSLGVAPGKLSMDESGVLKLTYTHGRACRNGPSRSTVISFFCDYSADLGSPLFIGETACTYNFAWSTRYACPASTNAVACVTIDPSTGLLYDLSALARDDSNWLAMDSREGGKFSYEFNICRTLVDDGTEACSQDMAACQTVSGSDEQDYGLGQVAAPEFVSSGHIRFSYLNGETCRNGVARSLQVNVFCPYDADGNPIDGEVNEPMFVGESSCNYTINWITSFACPLPSSANCSGFNDHGDLIDLQPLADLGDIVINGSIYLRVCGSTTKCPGDGACHISPQGHITSWGRPSISLDSILNVDGVSQTMNLGSKCDAYPSLFYFSEIQFICDPDIDYGSPVLTGLDDYCFALFTWRTSFACGSSRPIECTVSDPSTGSIYDLTSLTRNTQDWYAIDVQAEDDDGAFRFYINLCRPLVEYLRLGCPPTAAACLVDLSDSSKSKSIGEASSPSIDEKGNLYIQYDNGVACGNSTSGRNLSTLITFVCSDSTTLSQPVFLHRVDCTYMFIWETPAACSGITPTPPMTYGCSVEDVENGRIYSLSQLMDQGQVDVSTAHSHLIGMHTYKLSVCRSFLCGDSKTAGACQFGFGPSPSSLSLGSSTMSPQLVDGVVSLHYDSGSSDIPSCSGDAAKTMILFPCDPSVGIGVPEFTQILDDCTFVFTWVTSVTCDAQIGELNCYVTDSSTGEHYNLGALTMQVSYICKGAFLCVCVCVCLFRVHVGKLREYVHILIIVFLRKISSFPYSLTFLGPTCFSFLSIGLMKATMWLSILLPGRPSTSMYAAL